MFKKIKYKITFALIIFLWAFIILGTVLSIISIKAKMDEDFFTAVVDSTDLSITNCKLNITTAINATNTLVAHTSTLDLKTLNGLKQTAFCIVGVSYYQTDGTVIYSDGMSGVPQLSALMQETSIATSINDANIKSFYSLRVTNIASYYSQTAYDASYGIISYIVKIYEENNVVGYLFVDISAYFLYRTFFDYSDYQNCDDHASFIVNNELAYFRYQDNDRYAHYLSEQQKDQSILSDDNKVLIVNRYIQEIDISLTVVIALKLHRQHVLQTIIPIIVFTTLMIGISTVYAYLGAKIIVKRLTSLNETMRNFNLTDI